MSQSLPFSGILRLDSGESLSQDGYRFQGQDRTVIDKLLEVGAVTHRHNGAAALPDPTASAMASASSGPPGQIGPDLSLAVAYTILDSQGMETAPSPAVTITTPASIDPPEDAPAFTVDTTTGALRPGTYVFALSLTDAAGGETPAGTPFIVTIPAGGGDGRVQFSGISAIVSAAGASKAKLYRSSDSGPLYFMAEVTGDTFTDDGLECSYGISPTLTNTTNGANSLTVKVPATAGGAVAPATGFVLYISDDGSFTSPCRYDQYALSSAGATIQIDALDLDDGSPPTVSQSLPGADPILASDLGDLSWQAPVLASANLPASAAMVGESRVVLNDRSIFTWANGAWQRIKAPDSHLGAVALGSGQVLDLSRLEFAAGSGVSLSLGSAVGGGAKLTISLA